MIFSKTYRLIELLVLFVAFPVVYYFFFFETWKLYPLLAGLIYCLTILLVDKNFDNKDLYKWTDNNRNLIFLLIRFFIIGSAIYFTTYFVDESLLFAFPRQEPLIWYVVMVLYPVFSVYPQSLVYRTFFLRRYSDIIKSEELQDILSALFFGYLHLIFDNWIAVVVSAFGGYLLIKIYRKSNSLVFSALEHALYGNWLFTAGLGTYFYVPPA